MRDRPIECSQCRKEADITYKEIIDDSILCSDMCADCPVLRQKLHGKTSDIKNENLNAGGKLCCGHCQTPLDAIRMGNPLGCCECYNVFSEMITSELIQADKIPSSLRKNLLNKQVQSLYLGKNPQHTSSSAPATQLTTLHESLNEAIKKENYEQAAWIRDQIKALIGKSS